MRRRSLLSLASLLPLAAVGALSPLVSSCLSPTLPLPPPDVPEDVAQSTTGLWQVSGTCYAGALVTVFNTKTGRGVVVEDLAGKGLYQVTLPGSPCDLAWVAQETDDGGSPETYFVLQATSSGSPSDPNACP